MNLTPTAMSPPSDTSHQLEMKRPALSGTARIHLTAITALAPMVWGTTYLVTTEMLPAGHPWFAALMRALPAGLLALLFTRQLPEGHWWWKSLVLGGLNIGLFFPLLFIAAARLPGGVAATINAIQPLLVAGLALMILSERRSPWQLTWGVIGVVGVGLVVLGPGSSFDVPGVLAGLASALCMATGVVLTKKWGRPEGVKATSVAGWQLTAGGLILLVPTFVFDGVPAAVDTTAVLGYLWLGLVGGLLTYSLWFHGVGTLPVMAVSLLGLLAPLVAALLGALVLGETFTLTQLSGFLLAMTALVAGQTTPTRMTRQETLS